MPVSSRMNPSHPILVQRFLSFQVSVAKATQSGYVETMFLRRRQLRDIQSSNRTVRGVAERNAINAPIQGSAADLIKVAMVNVERAISAAGLRSKMVLQIHDELVFDAPIDEVDELKAIIRREMTSAIDFGVPLDVDIGVGRNWLEAH